MSRPLRIGYIDLSFHAASAAVVKSILERDEHKVTLSTAPHEKVFEAFGRGEIDFLVSAWLPASHGGYLAPYETQTRKLGALYLPYCMWGVPDYVPEGDVAQISDLLKPEVLQKMQRRIQGINPGAGISRFSQAMVKAYGLDEAGYEFRPGTEADCFDGYERAVAEKRWVVVPLWQPQYLHQRYRIRELHEPKGLLGGADGATLIIRHDAEPLIRPNTLQRLATLAIGNRALTTLDYRINKEGYTPVQAAEEWLAKNNLSH